MTLLSTKKQEELFHKQPVGFTSHEHQFDKDTEVNREQARSNLKQKMKNPEQEKEWD